jgi:hypothetical protein
MSKTLSPFGLVTVEGFRGMFMNLSSSITLWMIFASGTPAFLAPSTDAWRLLTLRVSASTSSPAARDCSRTASAASSACFAVILGAGVSLDSAGGVTERSTLGILTFGARRPKRIPPPMRAVPTPRPKAVLCLGSRPLRFFFPFSAIFSSSSSRARTWTKESLLNQSDFWSWLQASLAAAEASWVPPLSVWTLRIFER